MRANRYSTVLCQSESEIKTMSVPRIWLVLFESPPASWPKIKWHNQGTVSSFNGTIANAGSVGSIGRFFIVLRSTCKWWQHSHDTQVSGLQMKHIYKAEGPQVWPGLLLRKNKRASSVKVGSCGSSFGAFPSLLVEPYHPRSSYVEVLLLWSRLCFLLFLWRLLLWGGEIILEQGSLQEQLWNRLNLDLSLHL